MSLEELTLTAYQCPISISPKSEEDEVKIGHYIVFGNLKPTLDEMKKRGIKPYGGDVEFVLRRDMDNDSLYRCPKLDETRFYDKKTRKQFYSTPHNPLRINFFTYDLAWSQRPNELREEMITQLDQNQQTVINSAFGRIFAASLISGGVLGGITGYVGALTGRMSICPAPIQSTPSSMVGACYFLSSLMFGFSGMLLGLIYPSFRAIFGMGSEKNILFSNIKEEIINSDHLEVSEHPELRDIFRALQEAGDLEIKRPQSPDFYRACREVKGRLSRRIGTREDTTVDRYALKLYKEKVENWNNSLKKLENDS